MYKELTAESRGVTPSPSRLRGFTPPLYIFLFVGENEKELYMEIQTCIKCHKEKELNTDNFYRKNSSKRGFESQCKECRRISDKKKYQKKKEKILLQKKRYYDRKKRKNQEEPVKHRID